MLVVLLRPIHVDTVIRGGPVLIVDMHTVIAKPADIFDVLDIDYHDYIYNVFIVILQTVVSFILYVMVMI